MNHATRLMAILMLLLGLSAGASEVVDEIRSLVQSSITIQAIEESDGYVEIRGIAPDNQEISALMRAVSDSGHGDPRLESIKREAGVSQFLLRIRLRS